MRITNNMLIRNMMGNINDNLSRMEKLQYQQATNKKIRVPSDDPIVASRALRFRTDISEIEQFKKNTEDAYSWMEMTETALGNFGTIIHRARELTVQASNGPLTSDDKLKIEAEIKQLKKSVIEIGNSSYAGRYIFAGYKTDKPPFEVVKTSVGEKITYNGKFLNIGGPVNEDISDAELQEFYKENLDKIYGYPEIQMGKYNDINLTTEQDFKISLDGAEYTIKLLAGGPKNIESLITEIEEQPPFADMPPLIKIGNYNGQIKFTVLDDNIEAMKINNGTLDISKIGLTDGIISKKDETQDILYNIGVGNKIKVNLEGSEVMSSGMSGLFETFQKLEMSLNGKTIYKTTVDGVTIEDNQFTTDEMLTEFDKDMDRILKTRADIGSRMNYTEMMTNRLEDDYLNFTALRSKNEDADMAEVLIKLKSEEYLYRASLAAGAKIIQPNLLDFLR